MRSFYVILLAALLLPRLGAAQGNSDPSPSPSADLAWAPGKALTAPFRGLGRLIKHKPKTTSPAQTEPAGQAEPTNPPAETGAAAPASGQAQPTGQPAETGAAAPASGQAKTTGKAEPTIEPVRTGPTAFLQFQGSSSPQGLVLAAIPDVGFQFTRHFAGDIGVPIYFVRSPFSLVTTKDWVWTSIMGSPYIDVRYTTTHNGTNITSILTGTIPATDSRRTFTTGRGGVDWFNHFDRRFKGLTPFFNLGAANGTMDRYIMPRPHSLARPYYSLGFISDFEGGTSFEILRGFKVGGSAYVLVPGGPQKVYSRLVAPLSPMFGSSDHNRYFYSAFETIGPSRIARDNGYSAWVEVTRLHNVSVQLGFTRSVHYDTNAITLMVNFNGTSLLRTLTAWNRD